MGVFFRTQRRRPLSAVRACRLRLKVEALEERAVPSAYSDTILGDNPIGYWRLGESDPSQAAMNSADPTGFTDGTYLGGVTLGQPGAIAGDSDTAAAFDGFSGSVDIPSYSGGPFDVSSNFSLEAWVINNGQGLLGAGAVGRIFANGVPGSRGIGWGILGPGASGVQPDGVRFTTYGIFDYDSANTIVPEDGNWHYMAVTLDSSAIATFYLDGVQTDVVGSPGGPARSSELDLTIGSNPNFPEYFNGSIDEAAIYPSVLSSDQIANHYNIGVNGGPAPHHGSGSHATLGHDLNQIVLTTQPQTTLGQDLGSAPSGQLQQVRPGQQAAAIDQFFRSLPTNATRASDAQVPQSSPAQHHQAGPFALDMSLADDSTSI